MPLKVLIGQIARSMVLEDEVRHPTRFVEGLISQQSKVDIWQTFKSRGGLVKKPGTDTEVH